MEVVGGGLGRGEDEEAMDRERKKKNYWLSYSALNTIIQFKETESHICIEYVGVYIYTKFLEIG